MEEMGKKAQELDVENKVFSQMIRRRGQVPEPNIAEGSICHCAKQVCFDRQGLHADMCHVLNSKGRTATAKTLQHTTLSMCKAAGLGVKLEQSLIKSVDRDHAYDRYRMDLVISTGFGINSGNNSTYVDTTTNNAARNNTKLNYTNAREPGRTAAAAEKFKREKYKPILDSLYEGRSTPNFIGVAVEVQGRYGPQAEDFFNKLINLIAENKHQKGVIATYWYRRIAITLQASISRNILTSIKQHNKSCHNNGVVAEENHKHISFYDNHAFVSVN